MSRKRRKPPASPAVSLFPFLAVLICTMGVLIVMLVLAVQSSSMEAGKAKQEHQQEVSKQRDDLRQELDLQQFRVAQIAKVRPDVQQRLEDAKLSRSHLDDEIRKLTEIANQLKSQFAQLQGDHEIAASSTDDELKAIEKLKTDIAVREQEVTELRVQVAGKPTLYSIVPTRTATGTSRRPIYVECTTNGVELQPSGIKIPLSNFTRPIMPGNPLDAALLATREHWNKFEAGSSEGEPYPLIVVRPGGATSYAIARRAMSSWDDEFGYELVEAEKELDWGMADKNLTEHLEQAIDIAMLRQQQQVDQRLAEWMGPRGTVRFAAQNNGNGSSGRTNFQSAGSPDATDRTARRPASNATDASSRFAGQRTLQSGQINRPFNENGKAQDDFDTTPNDSLSRFAENRPQWRPENGANQENEEENPLRHLVSQNTNSLNTTGGATSQTMQPNQRTANASASAGQGQPGGAGQKATPDPVSLANVQPLANKRGDDWALPTRTPGATPYRRPIRVECLGNQYIVYSGDPALQPIQVAVESTASVDESIDQLIHQVWKQIEGWGMAEAGGYWKPVLRLDSDESGAVRAEELARKLEGSGIEIERLWR